LSRIKYLKEFTNILENFYKSTYAVQCVHALLIISLTMYAVHWTENRSECIKSSL